MLYVIEPTDATSVDRQDAAHDLARGSATAEIAVRFAFMAVESTERPVKIEVEILQGRPTHALLQASRSAAMICVGSLGLRHATQGRVGSTAAALAASAHCPVAIIPDMARIRQLYVEAAGRQCPSWSTRWTAAAALHPLRVLTTPAITVHRHPRRSRGG